MGVFQDLLAWHVADPPDLVEIERTESVCRNYQGNRNPFIDQPDLVLQVWGNISRESSQSDAERRNRCRQLQPCPSGSSGGGRPGSGGGASNTPSMPPISGPFPAVSKGAIALVGYRASSPDAFAFVVLEPLSPRSLLH